MKFLFAAMALTLGASSAAQAFDTPVQTIIDSQKAGKQVALKSVATLMRDAAAWCYDEEEQSCAWREIYLEVTDAGVTFELANAYGLDIDYAFTDQGVFKRNTVCQSGFNWLPSLRASHRADGTMLGGRELHDFRRAMAEERPGIELYNDCFDYLYLSADADQDVVTLLQRQYVSGEHDPANDVEVTLHFDAATAGKLTLRED